MSSFFTDELVITLESGHGGAGAVSFRREKYVPRGGPDGGDGGRGGNVLFTVQNNLKTLSHLRANKTYRAERGLPGEGRKRYGRDGRNVIITVPPGTRVFDAESGEILLDLLEKEQDVPFLSGGAGGRGNVHFATSRKQAPRFAQTGMPGEERKIRLELSIIADVGLVGLPNAGKSSLLAALTSARPKIAAYPFTTKVPHLGVLRHRGREMVLADIPGIIKGAARGVGLGYRFLKHINRARALLFLIDLSTDDDPMEVFEGLRKELADSYPELLDRQRYIVASKMDILESMQKLPEFKEKAEEEAGEKVIPISSATHEGLEQLMDYLLKIITIPERTVPDYYRFGNDLANIAEEDERGEKDDIAGE